MTSTPRVYSLQEAAKILGVHRNTVRNMSQRGELRTIRVGKFHRVPVEEINRALTEGTRPVPGKHSKPAV